VSEQELNLFNFSAGSMAQLCTGSAQIVGSKVVQLHPFSTPPNHVPDALSHRLLADTIDTVRKMLLRVREATDEDASRRIWARHSRIPATVDG
jgi:hypothetical protein